MFSIFHSFLSSKARQANCRALFPTTKSSKQTSSHTCPLPKKKSLFRLHPLFLIVGIYYAFTGELFLFLLSALVAVQHECAHAFASASLGYQLNQIILMPYGAVIDGEMKGISFKDELFVAICGPLCNLLTALFFLALWWLTPTMYAFTDTACYSSLSIALINLLPAFPLDGGRILKCALGRFFLKRHLDESLAERKAQKICKIVTFSFSLLFFSLFFLLLRRGVFQFSLLTFAIFLLVGAFGNRDKSAVYDKMQFSCQKALQKGTEIKRVAVLHTCTLKNALRFLSRGAFLILEVYDEGENHLFDLSQNEFSSLFQASHSPYETLGEIYHRVKKSHTPPRQKIKKNELPMYEEK